MGKISSLFKLETRSNLATPDSWMLDAFGGSKSTTGLSVTAENSLESTTVWAAVRMISSTVATLPLHVYERSDIGKERARTNPIYRLLHTRPNPEQSAFVFRELLMAHLLLFGDSFSEIERNLKGEPVALWPLHPSAVAIKRLGTEKVYSVTVEGKTVTLPAEDVLHVQGFGLDGQKGLFPVHMAREAIGLAKATEQFGASFFGSGAVPLTAISVPGTLTKEQETQIRDGFSARHQGLSNAQRVALLSGGMELNVLGIAPEHAQFLETRQFSVSDVARIFLIPPHLIGDLERATFSNIEHQAIQYVTHCIEPWTRRIEQEINYKLFRDERTFSEFSLEGLLRGDSQARSEFYTKMAHLGVYSINEIRDRENLNRIPDGGRRYIPLNMGEMGAEATGDK